MDTQAIYEILVKHANLDNGRPKVLTYSELSYAYREKTGEWHDPHGSWDGPLGDINNALYSIKAPALTALVVLKSSGMPSKGFWGCAPHVPAKPIDELKEWMDILNQIESYNFPEVLPQV